MAAITKWLFRLIWIPFLIVIVVFLVANREPVSLSLDPISPDNPGLSTPALWLWAWLFIMMAFGFAFGAAGMWVSGRAKRLALKDARAELKAVKAEKAALDARLAALKAERDAAAPAEPPLLTSENV